MERAGKRQLKRRKVEKWLPFWETEREMRWGGVEKGNRNEGKGENRLPFWKVEREIRWKGPGKGNRKEGKWRNGCLFGRRRGR